jgi:hypothetical protein
MAVTYLQFGRDYRSVMKRIKPGAYDYVIAKHDGRPFRVFQLSIWDDVLDADVKHFLLLPSRLMKDNTVFFMNVARDLMISLKIHASRGVHYLIEPRPAAQRLVAARLGLSVREYEELILKGGLKEILVEDKETLRRRYMRRAKELKAKVMETTSEAEAWKNKARKGEDEISTLLGKFGVARDDLFVSKNTLHEKEAEILLLRNFIADNHLTPPKRPRPPWDPG